VLLMGDGFQIPPVGGSAFFVSLVSEVVKHIPPCLIEQQHTASGSHPRRKRQKRPKSFDHDSDTSGGDLDASLPPAFPMDSPGGQALTILRRVQRIDFVVQHRSQDPIHTDILNQLRSGSVVPPVNKRRSRIPRRSHSDTGNHPT
jgi:hypothetical protein